MNMIFYAGKIDPETNDMQMVLVERQQDMNSAEMKIDVHYLAEPANSDPTLTIYHDKKSDVKEDYHAARAGL